MSKCSTCQYRSNIPGDAHIKCDHPVVADNPLVELACLMGIGLITNNLSEDTNIFEPLNIKANLHGIRSGWFNWPVNFDPTWLENCDGYKEK